MRQRILVPLDGSKPAEEAIRYLQAFVAPEANEVHLLTVLPDIDRLENVVQFPFVNSELQEAGKVAREHQEQFTRAYLDMVAWGLEDQGYQVQSHIAYGQPAMGIVHMAQALDVHLIIMTSHGRGENVQWHYGGVAQRVLDACACPILIVPVRESILKASTASSEEGQMAA